MYMITPKLQKSMASVYPLPSIISGAIYWGVPHYVIITPSFTINRAKPKSDIFKRAPGCLLE